MRRLLLVLAATALPVSLLVGTPAAQAADLEYVTLNAKGLKQTLIKKAWGPLWLGNVESYRYEVPDKGARPLECYSKGSPIKGEKSDTFAAMETVVASFKKTGESLDHMMGSWQASLKG